MSSRKTNAAIARLRSRSSAKAFRFRMICGWSIREKTLNKMLDAIEAHSKTCRSGLCRKRMAALLADPYEVADLVVKLEQQS